MLTLLVSAQTIMLLAQTPAKVKSDNVKMYRQPGVTAEVIKMVNTSDEVSVIRKFNSAWSVVTVGGETGYIHNTNLPKVKKASVSALAVGK